MDAAAPGTNYLNANYGIRSWLFTVDHKRIAILYLLSITAFFFLGSLFAIGIRIELLTPAGDFVQAETYNKLFTMHGIIMVFFFLIPSIPAVLGNFLVPLMIGARDLAFPRLNLLSWYIYMLGGVVHALGRRHRRRGHRLDVLHAVQQHLLQHQRHPRCARHLHHRLFVDPHRPQLHRHHPPHARTRADLVPPAAVHLGALRDQPDHGPRHAGDRHHRVAGRRSSAPSASAFSIRRWAATRCCFSICSGSIRTRPSTS